ncbi:hypothetical protein Tco_0254866 [Tanacetum coccineum]
MVSNPSQPSVSTPIDTGMHKEDQQATGGPTSLGVTSESRSNPQLSSGMSVFNLNKPIYSVFFIIHLESASKNDASVVSITEADPGNSAPGTEPHVLADQTKSVIEGLETVLPQPQPITEKGASSIAREVEEEEASNTIKLEDLAKLVSNLQPSFKDKDSPEDDPIIVVDDSDEDKEDEVHTTTNVETKDTSAPKSLSPRSSQIQELTNQVLIIQSQKHKLELEKNKAEAEAALLKAQPSFPNVGQLNELLIEPPEDLKEIPFKLEDFTKIVASLTSQVTELKTLQWELPAEFLSLPVQVEAV